MFYSILLSLILFGQMTQASTVEPLKIQSFDGVMLSAVFTLPSTAPRAVALILPGSGNVGMDGDVSSPMLGHGYQGQSAKLSEALADSLAEVGIASLRYSKRGFEDPAQLQNQTLGFLEKDAEVAFGMLKARFPGVKTSIVGLSEGATLAVLLANQFPVDSLFLLSLPTRPIDELFGYQYVSWPSELLVSRLDRNQSGVIEGSAFTTLRGLVNLPLVGAPWSAIDANQDGKISELTELFPAYQNFYGQVRALLSTPAYSAWYHSFQSLMPFDKLAAQIQSKQVFIYQGMDDAQVRWNWVLEESHSFKNAPLIRLFSGLGHCFSPMDGAIGEVKTTGPLAQDFLTQFKADTNQL